MATVNGSCPDCGGVKVTTAELVVRVCTFDNAGTYRFRCPQCQMLVVKPAEPRTIDLLVASGVMITTWDLPAELCEPHEGPPISHDELLDFHDALYDDAVLNTAVENLRT